MATRKQHKRYEYNAQWRARNRDRLKKYRRDYLAKNPERQRRYAAKWRNENRDEYREYQKTYHREYASKHHFSTRSRNLLVNWWKNREAPMVKNVRTPDMGYDKMEFVKHIESQGGKNSNQVIDHLIPLAAFEEFFSEYGIDPIYAMANDLKNLKVVEKMKNHFKYCAISQEAIQVAIYLEEKYGMKGFAMYIINWKHSRTEAA